MDLTGKVNSFYYHMSLYELQVMNDNDYYNGLSYNSLLYLNVIDQTTDCTVSRLSEALHITKSAVTLKINELVKQGAVVREQSSKDKRVFYLRLSPDIDHVMGIYDKVFHKIELELKNKYKKEQLEMFEEILSTISEYEWRKLTDE